MCVDEGWLMVMMIIDKGKLMALSVVTKYTVTYYKLDLCLLESLFSLRRNAE